MSKKSIGERIAALERRVQALVSRDAPQERRKDWKRTVGMFTGNRLMMELDAECQANRERERRKARLRGKKRRRVKV